MTHNLGDAAIGMHETFDKVHDGAVVIDPDKTALALFVTAEGRVHVKSPYSRAQVADMLEQLAGKMRGLEGSVSTQTVGVLLEVGQERSRQDKKWGEQNHRDGTGPDVLEQSDVLDLLSSVDSEQGVAEWARSRCEHAFAQAEGTFEHILTEEWGEAIDSDSPADLRAELLQVAAVAVAWVEKIDRDAAR